MLTELHSYYDAHGIGARRFACLHRHQCAAESPRFTTAKEAYVGSEYEKGTLPRLLFLSLDSGSADAGPATKTPIARFIERELDRPLFPNLCRTPPDAAETAMVWLRDAWQSAARLPIAESHLGETPVTFDRLTPNTWRLVLLEAHDCLNPNRNHRGRTRRYRMAAKWSLRQWSMHSLATTSAGWNN